jgi:hypothetical protein
MDSSYPISGIYRHYKGFYYLVLGVAHDANDESRTVVVYIGLELVKAHTGPRIAIRTLEDFNADVHIGDGKACDDGLCPKSHQQRFLYVGQTLDDVMSRVE